MDLVRLREVIEPLVVGLYNSETHERLPILCERLGLPAPDFPGSKRERMTASFEALQDIDLPSVATNLLERYPPDSSVRNLIQDLLWADLNAPSIPKRYRRDVARAISVGELYIDLQRFNDLLERLWIMGPADALAAIFGGRDGSLRGEINQHVYRNPGDWSVEYLFDKLGTLEASDRRFALFLEGLASADVRPDEDDQRRFVALVNEALNKCGVEVRETDIQDGYPVFSVVSTHSRSDGVPKYLIFSSLEKPDIRIRNVVNNEIEILQNADKVLVYDRPIGADGLTWRTLQSWWAETNGIADPEGAKRTLYRRLSSCLPANSPPQRILFYAFYKAFAGSVPDLPALLPEVRFHWDPKTASERGPDALTRFRMDFLLLLPGGGRVVVEVDGKHHYSRADGQADPGKYATMVASDRELRLARYDVYRFGAEELRRDDASAIVKTFFETLFRKYGVPI